MTVQNLRFKVTLIVVIISIGSSYAHQKCRMPNGYTGECQYLDNCKPLLDVNNKKIKTEEELLYLRESSCGTTSNFRYKAYPHRKNNKYDLLSQTLDIEI
ncbi:unnamed protein product [Parnassius apollo]|uniref:(apollo) hypothetical protein n=1 Tax=Parnassius apollo TaxID=110799 RepID=A0A8S3XM79_PARAO|nr:unnamed protein product [Parnassius apollo]